jgi:predicted negative regulator of RcsB-dependent stress response
MSCRWAFGLASVAAAMGFAWAVGGGEAKRPPIEEARRLEEEGKREEAFRAYLAIPGAEYAAARLARPVAKDLLPLAERLLDAPPGVGARPRVLLVRADLLLATGDKAGALEGYRQAVRTIAKEPGQGWEAGLIPSNYYPVEPPHPDRRPYEAQPFREGCGSHRDNWLLRRFLALEAWDDAAREFERIWGLHREFAGEGQFKGVGLQFALDYAYFLKQRDRIDASLAVLFGPFLRIDLDNNQSLMGEPYRGGWAVFGGLSRKEFIRLAYGAFKAAGKEDDLVAALTQRIEAGENRLRRVLARVRLHQGRVEDALTLEAAYIRAAGFDPLTSAYRLGVAYDDAGGKLAEAAAEFEKALALPYTPPKLPDKDEERVEEQAMMQMLPRELDLNSPAGRAWFHSDVLARLQRLYGALGQTDKVLALALRQFEADPARLESLESLEEAQRRFAAAGKGAALADWARQAAPKAATPLGKANLHWLLKDYAPAAEALGAAAKAGGRPWDWAIRGWPASPGASPSTPIRASR